MNENNVTLQEQEVVNEPTNETVEATSRFKFCNECGAKLSTEAKFCTECGASCVNTFNAASDNTTTANKTAETTSNVPNKKKSKAPLIITLVVLAALVTLGIVLAVTLAKTPVEDVVLAETELTLKEEETYTVACTVYPSDASDKTIYWSSSDTSVATVNENGMITAIDEGTCTITAKAGEKYADIKIEVKRKAPDFKALFDTLDDDYGWECGKDNSYLSADTNVYNLDDYSNYETMSAIKDMNEMLGLPDSLYDDMISTTWSMGKQNERFEKIGITVSWTYHPDKGLEVTYKLINE